VYGEDETQILCRWKAFLFSCHVIFDKKTRLKYETEYDLYNYTL